MARNSPNEVVEIVSSDDDFEEPRRRIGWNYQGKAINHASDSDKMPSKVNGKSIKGERISDSDSDDLEVLEVNPTPKIKSNYPTPKIKSAKPKLNGNKLPVSTTRKEIKILSRAPQSTISQFFSPPKSKGSEDKNISKSKINDKEKKYASDKYVSKIEDDEDNIVNKKDGKQEKTVIKWKKVTDTRDTAIPSDKSDADDSDSEESDDVQETLDESHDTIEISSQDEIHEVKLAKSREKDSKEHSEKNSKDTTKKRIQTIRLEGSIKKDDSIEEKEILPPPVTSEESKNAVEKFIFHWKKIKSSKDDKKIEDKIMRNYYASNTSYTYSRKFLKQLTAFNAKMTEDNIYMIIKDLLDNLKCYKDKEYVEKKPKKSDSKVEDLEDLTPEEKKKRRKLRKIEEKLKEISDKIREAEDAEVDLDDDDNSSYLIEDRLKRQFSKLDEYYCKIANCSTSTGRPTERKFRYEGSRYTEINKRISLWVNKHKEFPDYCDILNLVKKVTKDSLLPLRPETVRVQAQEIFRDVGKMLKDRRETDDLEIFYSRVEDEPNEPGHKDEELNKKLEENGELARESIEKVFQDWVDKESEWRENLDQEASKKKNNSKKEKNKTDNIEDAENVDNENAEESDDGREDDNEDDEDDANEDDDDEDDDDDISLPDISTGSNKDGDENDIESVIEKITGTYKDGEKKNIDSVIANINEKEEDEEDQGEISEEDVPILDSEEMDALALGANSSSLKRPLENAEESSEKKKCRDDVLT